MKGDMLVKLYNLKDNFDYDELESNGIMIKRALPMDKSKILEYIKNEFSINWAYECDVIFSNKPISTFIAVKDKKVVGFAGYEATAKGFFGPTGVSENLRGKGVGTALLMKSLLSMREEGYAYAIIGWVDDAMEFYKKTVDAQVIEDSFPGVYSRRING